jgi:uncharacterized protein YbjT (DUF2867 family)
LRVLLAGATGLVGQALLGLLEADDTVTAIDLLGRRLAATQSGKVEQHVAPLADWPKLVTAIKPDIAISTLGTTIKQAGSEAGFAAVDFDGVVSFARASLAAGAKHFLVVSSIGAHAGSRNFYLATKGKAEAELQTIGFDRVDIFRPGLLRGNRAGPTRIAERVAMVVSPITDFLTPGIFAHYRSIRADDVAAAMMRMLTLQPLGTYFHDNRAMRRARSGQ